MKKDPHGDLGCDRSQRTRGPAESIKVDDLHQGSFRRGADLQRKVLLKWAENGGGGTRIFQALSPDLIEVSTGGGLRVLNRLHGK